MYYAVQQVGVRGSGRVGRGLHLSSQVTRAVEGVRGSPAKESLLSIEEDELQGEVRTGGLRGSQSLSVFLFLSKQQGDWTDFLRCLVFFFLLVAVK